ncbi:MAG: hydrogenase maturation protease [Planctomycetota bacterium]|nr:hydrogenase maturation protease [Planctomycetota bacterium]
MASKLLVIGAGNILMGDDGVGVRVVQRLRESGIEREVPEAELVDAGTSALDVLMDCDEPVRLLVIDAVAAGKPPGTVYRFDRGQIAHAMQGAGFSLHDISLLDSLKLAEMGGAEIESATFIGVEPFEVKPSDKLSPGMEALLPKLTDIVRGEILAAAGRKGRN